MPVVIFAESVFQLASREPYHLALEKRVNPGCLRPVFLRIACHLMVLFAAHVGRLANRSRSVSDCTSEVKHCLLSS